MKRVRRGHCESKERRGDDGGKDGERTAEEAAIWCMRCAPGCWLMHSQCKVCVALPRPLQMSSYGREVWVRRGDDAAMMTRCGVMPAN